VATAAIAGHPCSWAGVVAANDERNHCATAARTGRGPASPPGYRAEDTPGRRAVSSWRRDAPDWLAAGFTLFTAALWAGPAAALLRDEAGLPPRMAPDAADRARRSGAAGGSALLFGAGRQLARAGAACWGSPRAHPPHRPLVRRVRNPQHIGTTLVALARRWRWRHGSSG